MSPSAPSTEPIDLADAIGREDWAKAKQLIANLPHGDRASPEQRALVELVTGGALGRLAEHDATSKANALANRIVGVAKAKAQLGDGQRRLQELNRLATELHDLARHHGLEIDADLAIRVMQALRKSRAFEAMAKLGDRLLALGLAEPEIVKLTAQGLIDTGQVKAALALLDDMIASTPKSHPERIDSLGLAGRASKQVYMDAHGCEGGRPPANIRQSLLDSAARYQDAYHTARQLPGASFNTWSYPAINLVAMLARATRDGIKVATPDSASGIASLILKDYAALGNCEPWDFATAGEAHIALGNWAEAERELHAYAKHSEVNAFQLAGTVRQLEEVWRLEPGNAVQGRILSFLKAQLLAKEGGHLLLTPDARGKLIQSIAERAHTAGAPQLEVFLSKDRPKPLSWFQLGLERANSVGLMKYRSNGVGFATGFLVRGGDFIPHMGDEPVLLTNAHVISERPSELNDPSVPSVLPRHALVEFTVAAAGAKSRSFELDRILWDSPRNDLDACLVALKAPPSDIPWLALSERRPKPGESRVIVIGHPGGERQLKVSLYDSPVLEFTAKGLLAQGDDAERLFLHYNNPTIAGNSGSAVFDIEDWTVIGLHHAGSSAQSIDGSNDNPGHALGNEGVFIRSICYAAKHGVSMNVAVSMPAAAGAGLPQAVTEAVASKPPPVAPTPAVAGGQSRRGGAHLAHDIPVHLIEHQPVVVSANISRGETEVLFAGLRPGSIAVHDVVPTAAMSVTLRSADSAFEIVPLTFEKQWIDRRGGKPDDKTTWKWSLRPRRSGGHALVLVVQGFDTQGGVDAALPSEEQVIRVLVQVDGTRRALTVLKWGLVAGGGGALSLLGQLGLKHLL